MNDIQLFANGEFELRITPEGDSFIVAAPGLARALGFKDAYDMVRGLPDTEKGTEIARTLGGDQKVWHVTEVGFYRTVGQRQVARIKDEEIRKQVGRFQDWVYGEVLPSIRRTGGYTVKAAGWGEPITFSFDEATAVIHQETGVDIPVVYFTRILRAAGILRQAGCEPKKKYRPYFWFTGSAWEIRPYALPILLRSFNSTVRELQRYSFTQLRLDLANTNQLPIGGTS